MFRFSFFKAMILVLVSVFGILILNSKEVCYASKSNILSEDEINKFQTRVLRHFELEHGRKVDFRRRNEAEGLYEAIKKFKDEFANVSAENFENAVVNYIKESKKSNSSIETLNRQQFEERLNSGSNFLRLYFRDFFYNPKVVDNFKKGEALTDLQKLQNNDMSNYSNNCLSATNCKKVAFNCTFIGPWLFWVCYDFAIDLNKANIIDSSVLDEIVAIMKYDHPEEFGFVKEIGENFNEDFYKNRYGSFEDKTLGEKFFLESYFMVPSLIFDSRSLFLDDFYRKKINESYFDVLLERVDEKKLSEIRKKIEPFKSELEKYDVSIGLSSCAENEQYDFVKFNIFCVNRNLAILKNKRLLAKLLGYSILFDRYDVKEGEMASLNIEPNPRNGNYDIVDYDCIAFSCSDKKTRERDKEFNPVFEDGKPVERFSSLQ